MGRQHQGMDRPGVRQVPEGSREQGKMQKTGCKITYGAPTTLAVKRLMLMMMSDKTMSWSLSPGITLILVTRLGLFVRNRLRRASAWVASSIIQLRPASQHLSRDISCARIPMSQKIRIYIYMESEIPGTF